MRRMINFFSLFCFDELVEVIRDVHVNDINDVVICGDFNCVLDNDCDIISGEKLAESTVSKFYTVLHDCDLYDTWRLFNPDCREYT